MAIPQFVAGTPLTAAELNVMLAGFDPTVWTAVTFTNSWVNYGGADQVAEYRKVGDMVQLRGRIKTGTLTAAAFTLPVGFRPPANLWFAVQSNGAFGAFFIASTGGVTPYYGSNLDQSVNCQFSVT